MGAAYYNEVDPHAADWLENLIEAGRIAPGDVDRRDIRDVRPDDLNHYTQCHFFAGIGVWSLALRNAGWPDARRVWTGSCPCQPFSAAGRGAGVADERHLWPFFFYRINQCRPPTCFGEQVASKDGLGWLDLVSADLEGAGYAVGAVDLCAAGVGAPHIRQRLYFCADDTRPAASTLADTGLEGHGRSERVAVSEGRQGTERHGSARGGVVGLGNACWAAGERNPGTVSGPQAREHGPRPPVDGGITERPQHADASVGRLADLHGDGRQSWGEIQSLRKEPDPEHGDTAIDVADTSGIVGGQRGSLDRGGHTRGDAQPRPRSCGVGVPDRPGPTNGFWRNADWLFCRDDKWRPVGPSTFPLVDGATFKLGSGGPHEGKSRPGMLRGYGNALVEPVARTFVQARLDLDTNPYGF